MSAREQLQLRERGGEREQVDQAAGEGDLAHRVHPAAPADAAAAGGVVGAVSVCVVMTCSFESVLEG